MRYKILFLFITIFLLSYFPLFYRLDSRVLRTWDESRTAASAVEMIQKKNFLVRHFEGNPDMWDSKPPLMQWMQIPLIHMFGINELAVRLPSAIAALLLCFTLIVFSNLFTESVIPGIIASMVLITSQGFVGMHIARTADHDSLLVLFITAALLSYMYYLFFDSDKGLLLFFILLTLGYLTKSAASLFILPGLFVITVITNKFSGLFKNRNFYIGILIFIVPIAAYYILREIQNHGYFKAVWYGEFFPRYLNTEDKFHDYSFWYYWNSLTQGRYKYWWIVLLVSIAIISFFYRRNKKFGLILVLHLITTFVIISLGTNNYWYDAPLYPLMGMTIGLAMYYVGRKLKDMIPNILFYFILVIGASWYFAYPYRNAVKNSINVSEVHWDKGLYAPSYYLRSKPDILGKMDKLYVVSDIHTQQYTFYKYLAEDEFNQLNILIRNKFVPSKGDYMLFGEKTVKERIDSLYQYDLLDEYKNAQLVYIRNELTK